MKPPTESCAQCVKIARRHTNLDRPSAEAVVSPTGKSHWLLRDGYTFCGKYGRGWPQS